MIRSLILCRSRSISSCDFPPVDVLLALLVMRFAGICERRGRPTFFFTWNADLLYVDLVGDVTAVAVVLLDFTFVRGRDGTF